MAARVVSMAVLLFGMLAVGPAYGQTADIIYCRQATFRIPFQVEPSEQARLREVQLYLSEDQGRTWKQHATANAEQRSFQFKAERDGLLWFTVRTVDIDGKVYPPSVEGSKPGLQVMVDTQVPTASLRALPSRQEQVGVEWDVRDDNLDLSSLQIDYRAQGSGDWQTLSVELLASGQKYWTPPVRGPVEVRLRIKDKAENQGASQLFLPTASGSGSSAHESKRPTAPANIKVVNSTKINLNYTLEDVGPSGVSLVELWYTTDGRSWQRYGEDADQASPFTMDVTGEGVYGLTLVVKSGVGVGDKLPQTGDPAQMWIEVDTTKPLVQLFTADPGRGADAGTLAITWAASDKNLASQPISLSYAEQADGSWTPIVTGLENTGRYVWRMPASAPYRFLVRVEATDRGGNVGRAESSKPVIVDLAQPKGRLQGVDGAGK